MKVKYEDLSTISEALGNLYEDGISIRDGVLLVSDMPLRKEYKESLQGINTLLMKGEALSVALAHYKEIYPGLFIGLVRIGENSGRLGETLLRLHEFYKRLWKIKREVINSLIYPAFLIVAIITMVFFLLFYLLPTFYESFMSSGGAPTGIVNSFYNLYLLYKNNFSLFITYLLSYGGIIIILCTFLYKYLINGTELFYKFKVFREVREYIFLLIISLIVNSGISLPVGISFCLECNDLNKYEEGLKEISNKVLCGKELSDALSLLPFISKYSLSMIKLGEGSGSLPNRLNKVISRLDSKTKESMKKLLSLIQPSLILVMALVVVFIICIFVLPMFDMIYGGVM